ncbi:COMM domain-containing protein 6-like protein [Planoprotostelium fungivorum]|uniref:COMM domain-containing protein 6-like protein n=1 Tax=Planoprotostelium fungivorum TaxID=1890364 RepID=A0A2P6MR90_9EUKA|nr:COMM domain-containing protein 6-like protein [Planoprotostelium fungivorum]
MDGVSVGKIESFKWRAGVAMQSSNCEVLHVPYVSVALTVSDGDNKKDTRTIEMSLSQFHEFARVFKEMHNLFVNSLQNIFPQHSAILGLREDHLRLMLIHLGVVMIVCMLNLKQVFGPHKRRWCIHLDILFDANLTKKREMRIFCLFPNYIKVMRQGSHN